MKLIIKQYLESLKEREELDAILPDLLSQMGLNVFSRPGRGSRQYGVDVAAVGSIDGGPIKVYLFSIKSGNLNRAAWDGDSNQSLRPSLNEILDVYIPNHLPSEHRDKDIVICICVGGDIQEQVRPQVEGYTNENKRDGLVFEEWNGDKLAELIEKYFLREDLLPKDARPKLRKSLALLDEPEASFRHFSDLITSLSSVEQIIDKQRIMSVRQIYICLWVLFTWSRDEDNLESAYLSSERALLYAWELSKESFTKGSKTDKSIQLAFTAILNLYQLISIQYLSEKILPHTDKRDGLSSAVRSSSPLDVNLKLFDVLGRLAIAGIWSHWNGQMFGKDDKERQEQCLQEIQVITQAIKNLISNNPTLFMPFKDDQTIDISIALLFLSFEDSNENDMAAWLSEILNRSIFSYECDGHFPCILRSYRALLEHPKHGNKDYREEVTSGSILYPTIALWAALLKKEELYVRVRKAKANHFMHCNFQLWYPDETSERHLYTNSDAHGFVLSNVPVDLPVKECLEIIWNECENEEYFNNLSSQKNGLWPLILVACRHYRIPVTPQFTLGYREANKGVDAKIKENEHV